MGAAGRDFHNFNTCYRDDPSVHVAAFTATQIPFIEERVYPPELAGERYPQGIPVYPESRITELLASESIDEVVFSYSDVTHEYVMERASLVTSLGADFTLLGAERTMLESTRPVLSVCAVRTGCGKSGVTRFVARVLKERGLKPVAVRHPMPYRELSKMRVQRYSSMDDLRGSECTIEEMEEFEPLVEAGVTVFAGVDYAEVLKEAESAGDFIIWDGGNNDLPFVRPDIELVVTDALRPGHETGWWPGEANLMRADIVVVNKAADAPATDVTTILHNVKRVNPGAVVVRTDSRVEVDLKDPEGELGGKKVLVVEDGPTLTHGGMDYGAGIRAAEKFGAEPVGPRPHAVGSIRETLVRYPHLKRVLPAMGYSPEQISELEQTIRETPADMVLVATPVDLARLMEIDKPAVRVRYEIAEMETPGLRGAVLKAVEGLMEKRP